MVLIHYELGRGTLQPCPASCAEGQGRTGCIFFKLKYYLTRHGGELQDEGQGRVEKNHPVDTSVIDSKSEKSSLSSVISITLETEILVIYHGVI